MVLEAITNPFRAAKSPWRLILYGFIYGTIAIFLSHWIFADYSSLVMVFLATIVAIPLFYSSIQSEEEKDVLLESEREMLKEHAKALTFMMFLFFGLVIAFTLWYIVLPSGMSNALFNVQSQTIRGLNQQVTGEIAKAGLFSRIFLNNIKVLVFCILFSFIYGMGALFILTWNASVIGVAAGNFIRTQLVTYANSAGMAQIAAYFYVASLSFVRYFIHGIPEILAYFVAALSGGIISIAITRHDFGTKNFEKIILDASNLLLIGIGLLLVAALIEVYITPTLF